VGAGSDRLLVLATCMENVGDRDITNVTYGGQAMSLAVEDVLDAGSSRFSRCELWYLDESGIQAASGNTFLVTYAGGSPSGASHAAATFTDVNQSAPILATASATTLSGSTISTGQFSVATDGLAVSAVIHGSAGSYADNAWGAGWTEGSDQSPGNWTVGTANTTSPYGADGTDLATATHTVSSNRQVMVAASLSPAPPSTPDPRIASVADQTFWVGGAPTPISQIQVGDAGTVAAISAANDIRIRIPAGFAMSWDTLDVAATITGDVARVSTTVSYEDGGKTLVIDVTSDFAPGDSIRISDLSFVDFTAISGIDNLELEVDNAGTVADEDARTIEIVGSGTPTISSDFDQSFRVGSPPVAMSLITLVEDSVRPSVTAANDIRIRVPIGFNMIWDTSDTNATILGTAAGKVSSTVSYEDGGKTLVVDVLTDFAAGDVITIQDLSFANFTAISFPADNLELEVLNDGGTTSLDDKTIFIIFVASTPHIASAENQTFSVGDPPTDMIILRVTDDPVPTIKAATDIRISIPDVLPMVWDVSIVDPVVSGRARSNVSPTVSYEDGGKTLVIDVLSDFSPDDWLNVKGLRFMSFASASAARHLQLDVNDDAISDAFDERDKIILGPSYDMFVSPDTVWRNALPTNGTDYQVDFMVSNIGSIADGADLLTTAVPGSAISVVSIAGTGITQGANPDSAGLASLAPGGSATATVTYSIADVTEGTLDTLIFVARSTGNPGESDDGRLIFTVIRPDLTIAKAVAPNGTQAPGTDLTYTVTVTNAGTEAAVAVSSVDSLAAEVRYKVGSTVTNFPAGIGVTVEYSDDDGATWTYSPVSGACGAPAGYDDCVTGIRWSLQDDLGATAPDNAGDVQFVARIK